MQILRRVPHEVYGGAVLTALKRSADMSVEEAIQYKVGARTPPAAVLSDTTSSHLTCDEMTVGYDARTMYTGRPAGRCVAATH